MTRRMPKLLRSIKVIANSLTPLRGCGHKVMPRLKIIQNRFTYFPCFFPSLFNLVGVIQIAMLINMGFDEVSAKKALAANNGDTEAAINSLLSG